MDNKKVCVFPVEDDSTLINFNLLRRRLTILIFFTALLIFNAKFVSAQTFDFQQTGQIRPIVSETESAIPFTTRELNFRASLNQKLTIISLTKPPKTDY